MLLLIDNRDSFTYNLAQCFAMLGAEPEVVDSFDTTVSACLDLQPDFIVIGPGPGRPENAGVSMELIEKTKGSIPLFGVCLGHQAIAKYYGGWVRPALKIMHGRQSRIAHDGRGLFEGLPQNFLATRYHSLIVDKESLPSNLEAVAHSEEGELMALRHKSLPLFGVQFHPESILTLEGMFLLNNFLGVELRAIA